MRRFKLFGSLEAGAAGASQVDFFDAGLLPEIEQQVQRHLDALLTKVLAQLHAGSAVLGRTTLSMVFRMLAAKVLLDRRHPDAMTWATDAASVIEAIGNYYGLKHDLGYDERLLGPSVPTMSAAWSIMRSGLSLRNVSSDDLAFVYENSFVTERTRIELGTHSTPRSVVEYACDRLPFDAVSQDAVRVLEPFAGAGVFLIAATRRLGDRMAHLSSAERHAYLVERVSGCDIDEFACQVAQLSLILADYPNRNGWKVHQMDLFASTRWLAEIDRNTIVFCNPPYQRFSATDRQSYGATIGSVATKALWAATRLVPHRPAGLALVLPRAFALDRSYDNVRAEVEAAYDDIDVLALPENAFSKSGFETCLLIGKSLRKPSRRGPAAVTRVTNAFVSRADLPLFNVTRSPSWARLRERAAVTGGEGMLWAGDLEPVWEDLKRRCIPLASNWTPHRGIEWTTGSQENAWTAEQKPYSRPGYHPNDGMMAFQAPRRGWLDVRPEHLRRNAHLLPWGQPKVFLNAARRSRGAWRVTAFVEPDDFAASQQFIALWPKHADLSLNALAAVLNGPVANAFLNDASFGKGLRLEDVRDVPLPLRLDENALSVLVDAYLRLLSAPGFDDQKAAGLRHALLTIDAFVLAAYDLAPRMERLLLRQFAGQPRQVPFRFERFYDDAVPALPLREFVDGVLERAQWPRLAPAFDRISQANGEAVWEDIR